MTKQHLLGCRNAYTVRSSVLGEKPVVASMDARMMVALGWNNAVI